MKKSAKNAKVKTRKLDYILDQFDNIQVTSKYPEITTMLEKFLSNFTHLENHNEMIEMELFRTFLSKKISYHNIDKYLLINFKLMKNTFKEMKNSDFYGIKDFFDKILIERYHKLTKKMKNIKNYFRSVLKSHGIIDFRETYLFEKENAKKLAMVDQEANKYSIIAVIKRAIQQINIREGKYDEEEVELKAKNKNINYKEISNKIKNRKEKEKQDKQEHSGDRSGKENPIMKKKSGLAG